MILAIESHIAKMMNVVQPTVSSSKVVFFVVIGYFLDKESYVFVFNGEFSLYQYFFATDSKRSKNVKLNSL
jgi:hypothetical protein